jgi:hypothetical protein
MQHPGIGIVQMGQKTRFPGVQSLGNGKYLVRFKAISVKTGQKSEHKHIVEAPNAAEAASRRRALQAELGREEATAERVRLSTFIDTWLISKKPELAPSTLDRYVRTLATHVLCKSAEGEDLPGYALGNYFLDAITHADIIKWRAAQQGAPSSVNGRLRILKTVLADATIEHRLPRTTFSTRSPTPTSSNGARRSRGRPAR